MSGWGEDNQVLFAIRWLVDIEPTDAGPKWAVRTEVWDHRRDAWNPLPFVEIFESETGALASAENRRLQFESMKNSYLGKHGGEALGR